MPTQFSQFNQGGNLQANDQVVGLRNNLNTIFNVFNGAGSVIINQVGHGFGIGDWVYINGAGQFALAIATAAATANAVGVVILANNADQFTLQTNGLVTGIGPLLVPGDIYYISAALAGDIVNVAPAHVRPVLIAYTDTSGFINYSIST